MSRSDDSPSNTEVDDSVISVELLSVNPFVHNTYKNAKLDSFQTVER